MTNSETSKAAQCNLHSKEVTGDCGKGKIPSKWKMKKKPPTEQDSGLGNNLL